LQILSRPDFLSDLCPRRRLDSGTEHLAPGIVLIAALALLGGGEVLGTPKSTLPDPESGRYIFIQSELSEDEEAFNHEEQRTRTVGISGKTVVIEADSAKNDIWNQFHNARDITELTIHAETLIVRSRFHLMGTLLRIHARELRMEDTAGNQIASFVTTPRNLDTPLGDTGDGEDGAGGLEAGHCFIFIETFEAGETTKVRFDLLGGDGQEAGEGRDGEDGKDVEECDDLGLPATNEQPAGTVYIFERDMLGQILPLCGEPAWPTNGEDAVADGRPGSGGHGGDLRGAIDLEEFIRFDGGLAGQTGESRAGGKAGRPQIARHVRFRETLGGEFRFDIDETRQTQDGADAEPPEADRAVGVDGEFGGIGSTDDWFHPFILRGIYLHALDASGPEHNNPWFAHATMMEYLDLLAAFKQTSKWHDLTDEDRQEIGEVEQDMLELLARTENAARTWTAYD